MHQSSMINMEKFRDRYLADRKAQSLSILDVGSTDIGGCYRPLFDQANWQYTGVDLTPGPNVDIVLRDAYNWREIASSSKDLIVSGQVLEHVEYFWITALEISRVLRPGGMACLIAPSSGPEHRYPVDCWRFYPDGMRAIAQFSRLECLEAVTNWEDMGDPGSDYWHDSVVVLRKPMRSPAKAAAVRLMQSVQRRTMTWRLE